MKPGWKTTEFWMSLAASLLSFAFASGLLGVGTTAEKVAGFVAMALTALGYTVTRGKAKEVAESSAALRAFEKK